MARSLLLVYNREKSRKRLKIAQAI